MIKKALVHYVQNVKSDRLQTPEECVEVIVTYIPESVQIIWECCDAGWSKITEILKRRGYKVVSTDIVTGFDFLCSRVDFEFDMVITNPPYSLKTEFLKRCYELGKPFALLVPLTTLDSKERFKLFQTYGINIVVLDRRVNYMKHKGAVWFASAWFVWYGVNGVKNQIFFEELRETEKLVEFDEKYVNSSEYDFWLRG